MKYFKNFWPHCMVNLNNYLCTSLWSLPAFHSELYHALIWWLHCFCCQVLSLLKDSMVWICTQSLDRTNMLISCNLRLHTQITINCACNFSRLFVLKISTELYIQCSVIYEYKRWTCSNISKWEYLCVQIWCNSIVWCAHFSSLSTGRQKLIALERGIKCSGGRQLSLHPIVDICISVTQHQSSAHPFKSLRLDRALSSSRKQSEIHYCELA